MTRVSWLVKKTINRVMGPLGELFLRRQCELLGLKNVDEITEQQIEQLAHLVSQNATLVCGKDKARQLERDLLEIKTMKK